MYICYCCFKNSKKTKMKRILLLALLFIWLCHCLLPAQEIRMLSVDKPQAVADLKTTDGAQLLQGSWFVQPANVAEAPFNKPGASASDALKLYPTGMKIKTHTIRPQVTDVDFD